MEENLYHLPVTEREIRILQTATFSSDDAETASGLARKVELLAIVATCEAALNRATTAFAELTGCEADNPYDL